MFIAFHRGELVDQWKESDIDTELSWSIEVEIRDCRQVVQLGEFADNLEGSNAFVSMSLWTAPGNWCLQYHSFARASYVCLSAVATIKQRQRAIPTSLWSHRIELGVILHFSKGFSWITRKPIFGCRILKAFALDGARWSVPNSRSMFVFSLSTLSTYTVQ